MWRACILHLDLPHWPTEISCFHFHVQLLHCLLYALCFPGGRTLAGTETLFPVITHSSLRGFFIDLHGGKPRVIGFDAGKHFKTNQYEAQLGFIKGHLQCIDFKHRFKRMKKGEDILRPWVRFSLREAHIFNIDFKHED